MVNLYSIKVEHIEDLCRIFTIRDYYLLQFNVTFQKRAMKSEERTPEKETYSSKNIWTNNGIILSIV